MAIDDRTTNLDLPLPNVKNKMADDCARLRTALNDLDGIVQQIETAAQNAGTVAVTAAEAAAEAMSKAADAIRDANSAVSVATAAAEIAANAKSTADAAKTTAESAATTASTAKSTADTANRQPTAQIRQRKPRRQLPTRPCPNPGRGGHWPETRLLWSQLVNSSPHYPCQYRADFRRAY